MQNARKLDLARLIAYIAICEEGSITAASRRLGIAQPALTVSLGKLETLLGTKLLVRDVRGVIPTEAGQTLLKRAYEIVGLAEATFQQVRDKGAAPEGDVSIGLPSSTAAVLAIPLINRLSTRFPGIRLRLVETFSGYLWAWLRGRELDIAVVFDRSGTPEISCDPFARENMHLIGRRDRLSDAPTMGMDDLARYPLVMPSRLHAIRSSLETHALQAATQLDVRIEIDAGQHLVRLVKTGTWFSVLAPCAVAEEIRSGELAATLITPTLTRSVCLAQRRGRSADPAVQCVVRELLDESRMLIEDGRWEALPWTAVGQAAAADPR